jgi:hypothetical protein
MRNAVFYKNCWLMPNSHALELWQNTQKQLPKQEQQTWQQKLDKHLTQLDQAEADLLKRYS